MKLRKVYTLVDDRYPDDYIAQCVDKDKISSHCPDVHMEVWTYEGFFLMKKEQIKEKD